MHSQLLYLTNCLECSLTPYCKLEGFLEITERTNNQPFGKSGQKDCRKSLSSTTLISLAWKDGVLVTYSNVCDNHVGFTRIAN